MLEEIHGDSDDQRLAWVAQDSVIEGKDLSTQMTLFVRHGLSYIDNLTVHDETIIYHQYDGFIIAIDWNGVQKYEIEMRIGLVRGLRCSNQFLISGGDSKNLNVWNNEIGSLYHKVHHQPCRIEFVYADETKVITLGREDPPVVVGYW
ncbi:unnamed protein product [Allacma fusca]|uniref:Uncharacterized protein n=1 Tax=Allacma fusca TaxID=39272 RepID=A0A8J2PET8_9HEXA|nr:unnamed protein product [Allacma fusca]